MGMGYVIFANPTDGLYLFWYWVWWFVSPPANWIDKCNLYQNHAFSTRGHKVKGVSQLSIDMLQLHLKWIPFLYFKQYIVAWAISIA